jgi:hypothetical protein
MGFLGIHQTLIEITFECFTNHSSYLTEIKGYSIKRILGIVVYPFINGYFSSGINYFSINTFT